MAKKKKTRRAVRPVRSTRRRVGRVVAGQAAEHRPVLVLKTGPFRPHEAALYVRRPTSRVIPAIAPIKKTETPKKLYSGFQRVERVISCDQKRERRRRAFFGYLNAPHAGKGAAKIRKSPRSDRFTVKC